MIEDFGQPSCTLVNNDILQIKLPKYFRDKAWAEGIGKVQRKVASLTSQYKKVNFDFSECWWADPLPLMSVLLEIARLEKSNKSVEITIPELEENGWQKDSQLYPNSPNHLLHFLNDQGFFDCLDNFGQNVTYPETVRTGIKNLHLNLLYEEAHFIPMTFFDVPKVEEAPEFARESSEKMLAGVNTAIQAKFGAQYSGRLAYKLRAALQEILNNVQEHAYRDDEVSRGVAIYVRYRTGSMNATKSIC